MSIGIFTGTIKSIERRYTDDEDFLCTVWLMVADLGEQCLRATARNEIAHQMDQLNEGDLITVSGLVDLDSISQPHAQKKVLAIPTILQVDRVSQLILVGYAGSDPTVKHVQNKETGEPRTVAKFNLAVNPPRKSEQPNWYPLEFWERNAEIVGEYVRKGSLIEVVGTVRMESWKDSTTGDDRARPVVRVDRLQLLGSKRTESEQNDATASNLPTELVAPKHSEASALRPTSQSMVVAAAKPESQPVKRKEATDSRRRKKSDSSIPESASQIPT